MSFHSTASTWVFALTIAGSTIAGLILLFLLTLVYFTWWDYKRDWILHCKQTAPYIGKDNRPKEPVRVKSLECPHAPRIKIDEAPGYKILPCPITDEHKKLCIDKNCEPMAWQRMTKFEFFKCCFSKIFVLPKVMLDKRILKIRLALTKNGINCIAPCNDKRTAADLLMNTLSVYNFTGVVENGLAKFYFAHTISVNEEKRSWELSAPMEIFVNLEKGEVDSAYISGRKLDDKEVLINLCVFWAGSHIALHYYANGGMDIESSDPFVREMSNISLFFNFLGWHTVSQLAKDSNNSMTGLMGEAQQYYYQFGIPDMDITALIPYSRYLRFVTPMREKFSQTFDKYKNRPEFKNITELGLFFTTIMHSMDHHGTVTSIKDVAHIISDDKRLFTKSSYGWFAVGIIGGHKPTKGARGKFKNAKHPFYKEIYEHMKKIDNKLADEIDMSICR